MCPQGGSDKGLEASPSPDAGEDVLLRNIRRNAAAVGAILTDLEAQGITRETMPPEALAQITELVNDTVERRWDNIQNGVDDTARDRVRRMERKVWDILEEGEFKEAFTDFVTNVCVTGTGVMVGPVMRNVAKNVVKYVGSGERRRKVYRREVRCIPVFESVNPLDCYPAPGALDIEDGPLCIVVRFSGPELYRFASSAPGEEDFGGGWIGSEVNALLDRHEGGGVKLNMVSFDPDRRMCENNGFDNSLDCTYEGVRCFMPIRGRELVEIGVTRGLDNEVIDPKAFYRTETIVVDNRVVYVCIHPDEMGVPVSKAVFYKTPGSWWGESIADKLQQCQCILNNTAKSIVLNESMTSSPMGYVTDVSRLTDKSPNALKFRAGKIFGFVNGTGIGSAAQTGAPIGVLPVPDSLSGLLAIWKAFQQQADLDSGLPAYSEGQAAGASGAMRTAQGLNTFVENTMRGMKMVMTELDQGGIARVARLTADWVLLYDKDESLKGDVYVRSVGLIGRVLKVQRDAARLQLLNLCLNSQLLTQSIGVKGVMELFRPSLVDLDINPDDIIPSKAQIEEQDVVMRVAQVVKSLGGMAGGGQQPAPEEGEGGEEGGGMQSGVSPVGENAAPAPGTVAERRGAA